MLELEGSLSLAPASDLALARDILASYPAPTPEQASVRARILAFIDDHPRDAHERACRPGHLTASAIAVDPARERVLLTFHRKLRRWLQFGGHCDGDANLLGVAWRETREESGIEPTRISTRPIDVDVHSIPARAGEPEHLHLDTRYLIELDPQRTPVVSAESLELGWFSAEDARALELDDSVRRLLRLALPPHVSPSTRRSTARPDPGPPRRHDRARTGPEGGDSRAGPGC